MMRNPLNHLILALVILAVVGGGYAFWYHQVEAKSAEVESLKAQIQNKTQDAQRLQQAKQELSTLKVDEGTIEQYFVSSNDVVPFLEQLAQTGKYLGASVQVVSVSANPGTPYGMLQLSLKISGSFDAVLRTIGSIEYGPYGTTVTSFTFDAANNTGSTTSAQNWTATTMVNVGNVTSASQIASTTPTSAQPVTTTQTTTASQPQTPTPQPQTSTNAPAAVP